MGFCCLRTRSAYGSYGIASFLGDTEKPPIDLLLKLRMTGKGEEVLSNWEFNVCVGSVSAAQRYPYPAKLLLESIRCEGLVAEPVQGAA